PDRHPEPHRIRAGSGASVDLSTGRLHAVSPAGGPRRYRPDAAPRGQDHRVRAVAACLQAACRAGTGEIITSGAPLISPSGSQPGESSACGAEMGKGGAVPLDPASRHCGERCPATWGGPMQATIVTFSGDGVGPEVMQQAVRVLQRVGERHGHSFTFDERLIGGIAIDTYGTPLRDEDIEAARRADGILLGAVGGPKWDDPNASVRPEQGLLKIRKTLRLFANLRPVALQESLI